jgi:hypothetical protein
MEVWLSHPAFQGGIAPFATALVAALVLRPFNLAGLSVIVGFAATAYLLNGVTFEPLTATRKIILVSAAAAVAGILVDAVARSTRAVGIALAIAFSAAAVWVFLSVLAQKAPLQAAQLALVPVLAVAVTVALTHALREDPVRAGAAGLGLGLGAGVAALLGASAVYGLYGIALGAGSGAFLLAQMLLNRRTTAGAALTLPLAVAAALFAAGAVVLASLAWYAVVPLVLVPLAVRLPLPQKGPVWVPAIVASIYALAPAALSWSLAWRFGLE